ncbi:MAG: hypothetical protein LBJ46_04955 [Planctomycetota bacterium]|nr:hypothetical protein [Planctomycetota bacterium]
MLASAAEGRKPPHFDAQAILSSVSRLVPEPAQEQYRLGFLAALTASAAAASLAMVSYASAAWLELRDPFLALSSLTNAVDWLWL